MSTGTLTADSTVVLESGAISSCEAAGALPLVLAVGVEGVRPQTNIQLILHNVLIADEAANAGFTLACVLKRSDPL